MKNRKRKKSGRVIAVLLFLILAAAIVLAAVWFGVLKDVILPPSTEQASVDTSEAENMPGVYGFVDQLDLVGRTTHHDILDDKIRFFGEAVVGVAAETEEQALEALEKVQVTYKVLPGVLDFASSTKEDAPRVWPGGNVATWRGASPVSQGSSLRWEKGNTQEAIEKADHKVSITVKTHIQFQNIYRNISQHVQ